MFLTLLTKTKVKMLQLKYSNKYWGENVETWFQTQGNKPHAVCSFFQLIQCNIIQPSGFYQSTSLGGGT